MRKENTGKLRGLHGWVNVEHIDRMTAFTPIVVLRWCGWRRILLMENNDGLVELEYHLRDIP